MGGGSTFGGGTGGGSTPGEGGRTTTGLRDEEGKPFEIRWMERRLPRAIEGDYATEISLGNLIPEYNRKSALVYFYSSKTSAEEQAKAAARMFTGDVVLASRWFHCYKIDVETIQSPVERARLAPKLPTLVLLGSDGATIATMPGGLSGAKLFKGMHDLFHKEVNECIGKRVDALVNVLTRETELRGDLDKARAQLTERETKQADRPSAQRARKVEEAARVVAQLEAKLDELKDEERAIMEIAAPVGAAAGG